MTQSNEAKTGRNEPCPCGSGKKFKRCHGMLAKPATETPPAEASDTTAAAAGGGMFGGFPGGLPEGMDPAHMMQMAQAIQRLPKGQLQQFQSLLRKAMNGKDVARELADFQRSLPTDVQSMFMQLDQKDAEREASGEMPAAEQNQPEEKKPSRFTQAWKGLFKKKS